jgi:hypothetical protein
MTRHIPLLNAMAAMIELYTVNYTVHEIIHLYVRMSQVSCLF